jgi:predicted ArsR family transcriptional regulator
MTKRVSDGRNRSRLMGDALAVVLYLEEHEEATAAELAAALEVHHRTALRWLHVAEGYGLAERLDDAGWPARWRSAHYRQGKEGRPPG